MMTNCGAVILAAGDGVRMKSAYPYVMKKTAFQTDDFLGADRCEKKAVCSTSPLLWQNRTAWSPNLSVMNAKCLPSPNKKERRTRQCTQNPLSKRTRMAIF